MDKDNRLEQRNNTLENSTSVFTYVYKLQPTSCGYVEIPRPILKRNNYCFYENMPTNIMRNATYSNNICDILFGYNRKQK
jgi:hypothetical protein